MRKIALAIAFLVLATPLFVSAKPARSPHEDPSQAVMSSDLMALLTSYTSSFSAAATGKYQNARDLLAELPVARIPDEYRDLANRFSSLAGQLIDKMDNADRLLDQAAGLIATNQPNAARASLDIAATDIDEAQSLLNDITTATSLLKAALGNLAPPVFRQIEAAQARLEQSTSQLGSLLSELDGLRQVLSDRQTTQLARKTPTFLTADVAPPAVFVGDKVTVSGALSSATPLPGREVILRLGEETTVITQPDGSFTAAIDIPYIYSSQATLQAFYLPTGNDADTYLATSLPVVINTSFYATTLDVSIPARTHPGFPTPINGRLASTGEDIERTLEVYLDDTLLSMRQVKNNFSFIMTPPVDVPPGKHKLSFTVPAENRYAGATKELAMDFSFLPMKVDIAPPSVLILPFGAGASGRVTSTGSPVPEAAVQLQLGRAISSAVTDANGTFNIRMNTSLDLSLIGQQEMTMLVTPTQPWYEPVAITQKVFTVNPANLFLMLFVATSLSFLIYRRTRTMAMATASQRFQVPTPAPRPPVASKVLPPAYDLTDFKGTVLSAYFRVAEEVSGLSGIVSLPAMTLREFLKAAAPRITHLEKPFAGLTILAERALYSPKQVDAESADSARKLARTIEEELRHAPP